MLTHTHMHTYTLRPLFPTTTERELHIHIYMENTEAASAKHLSITHSNSTIQPQKGLQLQSKCTTNKGNCKNKICPHVKPKLQRSQNIQLPSEKSKGSKAAL